MNNPCKDIVDPLWANFGYDTKDGCDICGRKPAKSEPYFGYKTCEKHCWINPVRFSRIVHKEEKDPLL